MIYNYICTKITCLQQSLTAIVERQNVVPVFIPFLSVYFSLHFSQRLVDDLDLLEEAASILGNECVMNCFPQLSFFQSPSSL